MRTAWGSTRERRHAGWREEAVWFPWAFGSDRIRGDSIDSSSSARATLLGEGLPVSLVVEFDEDRRAARVRGERYRAVAALLCWRPSRAESVVRKLHGLPRFQRPASAIAGRSLLDLNEGQFSYARFRLTEVEYKP